MQRVVQRPATAPFAELNTPEAMRCGRPWGGAYATARDVATFGQLFLNGGRYGDARLLSRASVAEMTRNQIPGVGSRFGDEFFPEACWGLGWGIKGPKKALRDGSLRSPATFSHSGAGGVHVWVDPEQQLVGVYFSVVLDPDTQGQGIKDLFMNIVAAAVED